MDSCFLACSSNSRTVHVFKLDSEKKKLVGKTIEWTSLKSVYAVYTMLFDYMLYNEKSLIIAFTLAFVYMFFQLAINATTKGWPW